MRQLQEDMQSVASSHQAALDRHRDAGPRAGPGSIRGSDARGRGRAGTELSATSVAQSPLVRSSRDEEEEEEARDVDRARRDPRYLSVNDPALVLQPLQSSQQTAEEQQSLPRPAPEDEDSRSRGRHVAMQGARSATTGPSIAAPRI